MPFRLKRLVRVLAFSLLLVAPLSAWAQDDCDITITPPDEEDEQRFRLQVSGDCIPCELGPTGCLHTWQADVDGQPFEWSGTGEEAVFQTPSIVCLPDGAHVFTTNVDYTGWTDCWCRSGVRTFPFTVQRSDGVVTDFYAGGGGATVFVTGEFAPPALYKITHISLTGGVETVVYQGAHAGSFSAAIPDEPGAYVLEQTNVCTNQQAMLSAVPEVLDTSCNSGGSSGGTSCDSCKGTCFGGPIKSATGNMRYVETDPLPGSPLTRVYDSARPGSAGWFGSGWFSILDARVVASAHDRVFLMTEEAVLYVFRSEGSSYEQEWPAAVGTARATLENDFLSGGWRFRRPDEQTTYRYDVSGLREIRSLDTGRAVIIDYDGFNRPATVSDSWGTWRLDLTIDPLIERIAGISVADHPTLGWQYFYTGDKLTSVRSASNALWRTYEYGPLLEAVRDPLGNLIESHTFDGHRAVTDTSAGHQG